MKIFQWLMSLVLFIANGADAVAVEGIELIERAWNQRTSLNTGELTVYVSRDAIPQNGDAQRETRYNIFFSDRHLRVDRTGDTMSTWSSGEATVGRHRQKVVFGPETLIEHIDVGEPTGRPTAANITYPKSLHEADQRTLHDRPDKLDPRCLGIVPARFAAIRTQLDDMLAVLRDSKLIASEVVTLDGGVEAHRLSYQTDVNELCTIWIAQRYNYSVVKSSLRNERRGKVYEQIVRSEMAEFASGNGNVWFPNRVVYEKRENQNRISYEEWVVERAIFNRPVDAGVFSLAGMDLPQGTYVAERPPHPSGTRIWNGTKLVPVKELPFGAQIALNGGINLRRMIVIILILIAIAAFVVWRTQRPGLPYAG